MTYISDDILALETDHGIDFEWAGETYQGIKTNIMLSDDPEMAGIALELDAQLIARTSQFDSTRPANGELITIESAEFRIVALTTIADDSIIVMGLNSNSK